MRSVEFLQLWLQEKGEYQELQITLTHIVLESSESLELIELEMILNVDK